MPNEEQIILVDAGDVQIGAMGKLGTHKQGLLHRAFSIVVKNGAGQIMLQRRAQSKYHSGGLWTNTCCGHPRDGEELMSAAHRRLKEEMGFDCDITEVLTFTYEARLDKGLTEHEFLHVFVGTHNDAPVLNPEEADDWKWVSMEELTTDIAENAENYTFWFKILLEKTKESGIIFE